eukprot:COSAG03_NODE_1204_length_4565_cov_8.864084_2_plen_111_part_00
MRGTTISRLSAFTTAGKLPNIADDVQAVHICASVVVTFLPAVGILVCPASSFTSSTASSVSVAGNASRAWCCVDSSWPAAVLCTLFSTWAALGWDPGGTVENAWDDSKIG